ncbi:hypothetical protein HYW67_02685 [Candidatus Parcubacteria bacterium]|nr:hypothetical protein [Candidatus Parcubacteria bacterium]
MDTTITIPKELMRRKENLILIPRKKYEELLGLEQTVKRRLREEADTDLAVRIYKKEKRQGKLKIIKSLADLA